MAHAREMLCALWCDVLTNILYPSFMAESTHVAIKLSELIRNRFPATTKQKKIVELLKEHDVEVSEGLLSRLFNGFYEVRLESRLFKELHKLLAAPHESQEDFWQRLLQDYDPAAEAEADVIKIGLSLKSFWARPFVALMAEDSLPAGFEIVYGRRVIKKLNENKTVIPSATQVEKILHGRKLHIPPQEGNHEHSLSDEHTIHNDELYLNQNLFYLLKNKEIDLLVSPESIALQTESDVIPIARIGAGFTTQCVLISSLSMDDYQSRKELLEEEEKSGQSIKIHRFKKNKRDWVAFYHNYIANERNAEQSRIEYIRKFIEALNIEYLLQSKSLLTNDDETNDYFWVRTLENTLTAEAWAKFLAILKQQCKNTEVPSDLEKQYSNIFSEFSQEQKENIIDSLRTKYQDEANFWTNAYEQLSQRISKPISLFSESYPYQYQVKERIVKDVLLRGGSFALVAFSPFNNMVVSDIVTHFNNLQQKLPDDSTHKNHQLLIQRFNLSHMIGQKDVVYLYGNKRYLKEKIEQKQLVRIGELLSKLRQATEDIKLNRLLIEKLALHHFFTGSKDFWDNQEETQKKRDWFYKRPENMEKLIEEYQFAEQYNDFRYKVFRNDEYARFLEELLSKPQ